MQPGRYGRVTGIVLNLLMIRAFLARAECEGASPSLRW